MVSEKMKTQCMIPIYITCCAGFLILILKFKRRRRLPDSSIDPSDGLKKLLKTIF